MKDCHAMRLMKRIGPIDEEKPLLIMPTTALHLGHLADVLFQSDENKERKVKHYITVGTVRIFIEPSFVITLDCDALAMWHAATTGYIKHLSRPAATKPLSLIVTSNAHID